jgi:hypothetical protein
MKRPAWYRMCFGRGPKLYRQPVSAYMRHVSNCVVWSIPGAPTMASKVKYYARMNNAVFGDPRPVRGYDTANLKSWGVVGLYAKEEVK